MDRIAEWRPVDPAGPDGSAELSADGEVAAARRGPTGHPTGSSWRVAMPALVGLSIAGVTIVGAVALVVLSGAPSPAVAIDSSRSAAPSSSGAAAATIVIDVEGAVANPGVWRLPAGSRVGDAITAAGGYSAQVDIAAASSRLNLAQPVADGQQVHVPLRGEATSQLADTSPATGSSLASPALGGVLVDVNHASAEELDTLPGIGPVTAAKIIAARDEAAFTSVDELLQRGVVGQATFDKIRPLITAGH